MTKASKKLLLGASAVIALTLAGCSANEDTSTEVAEETATGEVQEAQPMVIEKPEIIDVEDDEVDTAQLQANLDAINEGERLPDYVPVNDEERVLELPAGQETNDSVYRPIDPKELSEGTHLAYIGRDTCPYCVLLRTNLDPVVEQLELGLKYVDTDNKEYEQYMVENFGMQSVPMLAVFHDGEVVAMFPQANMYLAEGVDYQSLANGLGDLTNIYLTFKHDLSEDDGEFVPHTHGDAEVSEDVDGTEDSVEEETDSQE